MKFDGAGVLRDDDGLELARVEEAAGPDFGRVTLGAETYEIVRRQALGRGFELLDAGSQVVYAFHPGLRRGGTVCRSSGEPVAQVAKPLWGRGWKIVPEGREAIAVRREQGLAGPVISGEGRPAAPALRILLPASIPPAEDLRLLLAFACRLIAGWEAAIPQAPQDPSARFEAEEGAWRSRPSS